jgi:hypothetical protein
MKFMKKRHLLGFGMTLLIFSNHDFFLEKLNAEEIISRRTVPGRISNSKAEKLIEAWFFNSDKNHHLIDNGQKFPVKEVTTKEVWDGLKGQVFVVDEKGNLQMNAGDTFLIKDTKVYHLGFNLTEYCVADLNKDGKQELIFVRSIPGDVCFSADLGVFTESLSGSKVLCLKSYYSCGDFHLKKMNNKSVEVDVQNEDSFTFAKGSIFALGRVGFLHRNGQIECVINFYPNLPQKTLEKFH